MPSFQDVDPFLHSSAPIDKQGLHNTTSVYTPAQVFCMLPTELSYGLTSLNPHEDRKAFVMDVTFVSPTQMDIVEVRPRNFLIWKLTSSLRRAFTLLLSTTKLSLPTLPCLNGLRVERCPLHLLRPRTLNTLRPLLSFKTP